MQIHRVTYIYISCMYTLGDRVVGLGPTSGDHLEERPAHNGDGEPRTQRPSSTEQDMLHVSALRMIWTLKLGPFTMSYENPNMVAGP